jgi:beta-mannanase
MSWRVCSLIVAVGLGLMACRQNPATPAQAAWPMLLPSAAPLEGGPNVQTPINQTAVAHGAFPGDLFAGMLASQARKLIDDWERLTGKRLALIHMFTTAPDFPETVLDVIAEHGATPLISLSPNPWSLEATVQGAGDADYREFAEKLRDWTRQHNRQVLVRWGWEMNGAHPWAGVANGNGPGAPARFIQAWQHVVGLFRASGATREQVPFVWCPDAFGQGAYIGTPDKWNYFDHYYPGDDWVDWVGLDAYCSPDNGHLGFTDVFDSPTNGNALSTMAKVHGNKPMLIGELAASNRGDGRWLVESLGALTDGRCPNLRAICWFNKDQDGSDWQLRPDTVVTQVFRQFVVSPLCLTTMPIR